jgi:putative peptidoglycan lipid II flippase
VIAPASLTPDNRPPPPAPEAAGPSVGAKIFRAAMVVALANVLVKLLGLVRVQSIGGEFGVSQVTDSFWTIYNGVIMSLFLIGEECLGPAFLPVFMKDAEENGEAKAWRFASTVFNAQFLVLLLTVGFLMLWPAQAVKLVTSWKEQGASAANLEMATGFLRASAPALLGLSLGSLTFMLLNARKKFFLAALGDGSNRALFLAAVVTLGSEHWLGAWALVAGVVAGSVAKVATHLPGLWRQLRNWRAVMEPDSPQFRAFLVLIAPLLIGSVFSKFRDVFSQIYVLSAVTDKGLISINSMGRALTDTLAFLVPYSLSVGMFPFLVEMVDRGEQRQLGEILGKSSRLMLFIFLPLAAVLAVASGPMARLLFEMGKLKAESAELIGLVVACYAAALPFFGVERVMLKGFFSNRRTVAPMLAGIFWSAVSMAACWYLVCVRGWSGPWALGTVALAYATTRILKALTLVAILKRSVPMLGFRETAPFVLKLVTVAGLATLAAWLTREGAARLLPLAGLGVAKAKLAIAVHLGAIGLAATAAFLLAAWLLRMEEFGLCVDALRPRVAKLLGRFRS